MTHLSASFPKECHPGGLQAGGINPGIGQHEFESLPQDGALDTYRPPRLRLEFLHLL